MANPFMNTVWANVLVLGLIAFAIFMGLIKKDFFYPGMLLVLATLAYIFFVEETPTLTVVLNAFLLLSAAIACIVLLYRWAPSQRLEPGEPLPRRYVFRYLSPRSALWGIGMLLLMILAILMVGFLGFVACSFYAYGIRSGHGMLIFHPEDQSVTIKTMFRRKRISRDEFKVIYRTGVPGTEINMINGADLLQGRTDGKKNPPATIEYEFVFQNRPPLKMRISDIEVNIYQRRLKKVMKKRKKQWAAKTALSELPRANYTLETAVELLCRFCDLKVIEREQWQQFST